MNVVETLRECIQRAGDDPNASTVRIGFTEARIILATLEAEPVEGNLLESEEERRPVGIYGDRVICSDGTVWRSAQAMQPGRREEWVELDPIPGTPAASELGLKRLKQIIDHLSRRAADGDLYMAMDTEECNKLRAEVGLDLLSHRPPHPPASERIR